MSFQDIPFIVIYMFAFIILVVTTDYAWNTIYPVVSEDLTPAQNATLSGGWDNNVNFFDNAFTGLFILFLLSSVLLTALLATHPVILFVWLLFNMLVLLLYDSLNQYLTAFATSPLNDAGAMSTAITFFSSGVPKVIVIMTVIMAIVMLGKKGWSQ